MNANAAGTAHAKTVIGRIKHLATAGLDPFERVYPRPARQCFTGKAKPIQHRQPAWLDHQT